MTEREKHYVIVPEYTIAPYLEKGYVRSEQTAAERIGEAWKELPDIDRRDLVVIEIDADKHEALNRNPRRFAVKWEADYFTAGVRLKTLDLLEEGAHECVVANALRDEGPEHMPTQELHLTAVEAAVAAAPDIQRAIRLHQVAIQSLEHFLRNYT